MPLSVQSSTRSSVLHALIKAKAKDRNTGCK